MGERLARLEGALDGLRRHQDFVLAAIALLAALMIGFGVYGLQRIDAVDARVSALPGQISADLRDISRTLAASITAAKQSPPAVIYIPPAPAPPK